MGTSRRVALLSLMVTLLLLVPGHAAGRALRPLTLWLDWYPNSDHAGIYVALAKGYYARAGLAVTPQVPAGAADALTLVAHGTGDLAISYEPAVLLARAQHIPVVTTAAIVQRPLDCVMALARSDIARPRQLQGKVVGIAGLPNDYTNLAAIVRHDGGDPRRVKVVVVGYGLLPNLLARRVDAVLGVYWTWEVLQAEQQGYRVTVMRLDRNGVPSYDELVFATGTRQLHDEAPTLRAFQRATFQGYAYAAAHPAAAARLLLRAPGVLSRSAPLIERSIRLLGPLFHDGRGHYGTLSAARWQSYADWMTRARLLPTRVDVRGAVTTELLP
jgi:putative hydroxymethylpyrimidine transport system substrate-binding protein